MDINVLKDVAYKLMANRKAHLEREKGFIYYHGQRVANISLKLREHILKDDDYVSRIETIIRDLAAGEVYLSPQAYEALAHATRQEGKQELLTEREREILRLVDRGLPNPQIAQALHLSAGTVRNHLSAIYRKLGVRNKHEALPVAKQQGLL